MTTTAAAVPETSDDSYINDLLTEEEIAALEDGDHLEDFAGEGQDDAEALESATAQVEGDQAAAAQQVAQEDTAAAQQAQEQQQPEPQPAQQAQTQPDPLPNVDIGELDQQIDAFKAKRQELLDQFDDGDLTGTELTEALDGLDQEADGIKAQRAIAQNQIDAAHNNWKTSVTNYLGQHDGLKTEGVLQRFDHAVRYVTANPANATLTYEQQLEKAHRQLIFEGVQGVPQLDPAPTPPPKTVTPKGEGAGEKGKAQPTATPAMRTPPPTLNSVPASEVGATGSDSPYAALEALVQSGDSDAIELAMAKLTPEQRDEFASMDIS